MPDTLWKEPYSLERVPLLTDFHCGDKRWEREVADWITAPVGVIAATAHRSRPSEVWLYFNQADELVGYASLGKTRWAYPEPSSTRLWVYVIPWIGVKKEFQGRPNGEGERRYSQQMIDDLILEANARTDSSPLLSLFVHPQNERGKRFFQAAGFRPFRQTSWDQETETLYEGMILDLPRGWVE